ISLSDFDGEAWLDATPYLIDNLTGFVTNLMEDAYNFTSDMGEYNDRFTLVFENRSLANQDALASSVSLYPNPAGDVVTIASPTAAITMVELRDIRGRLILSKSVASQNVTTINIASLGSALYLVTITTDSGSITSRLIVN
ncbi:T9SS type A sorting domain-containing protein, partial [Flavobacteriaceae bacterium]|nr:T9SS type A sorting domain-containing protein [Flavobacteriaceae bacterium]